MTVISEEPLDGDNYDIGDNNEVSTHFKNRTAVQLILF